MEAVFHETQEGSLCAQHCLNALLQGSYFTAVDLAELGRQLDESEMATMAEAGLQSEEYRRFAEQPSGNYDDSGFFSIQVLENALRVWNLSLCPFKSSDEKAVLARSDPRTQTAYICNFKEHWLTIRKLGNQWFNLNSVLTGPELISDTFLALFLKQLETEGYSIFIVDGDFPDSEADQLLKLCPAVQPIKPKLITDNKESSQSSSTTESRFSEADLRKALAESQHMSELDDPTLQKALKMSMEGIELDPGGGFGLNEPSTSVNNPSPSTSQPIPTPAADEIRKKRSSFLDKLDQSKQQPESADEQQEPSANQAVTEEKMAEQTQTTSGNDEQKTTAETTHTEPSEMTEEEMLKVAIEMSMGEDNKEN